MKANIKNTKKKMYCSPKIERIKLDNEISLDLASDVNPDTEPNWSKAPEYFDNDPFKTNRG